MSEQEKKEQEPVREPEEALQEPKKAPGRKKKNSGILYVLIVAAAAVLGFSLWQLSGIFGRYQSADDSYDEIFSHMSQAEVPVPEGAYLKTPQEGADETPQENETPEETWAPEVDFALTVPDFDYLRSVNSQVIGWIQIPGTKINYPIVQGTDNEYYLNHTFAGEENTCGAIFMDAGIDEQFSDKNPIIHGHNLKSGAMFSRLNRYSRRAFWDANRYIYITTPDGLYIYEVFSAYEIPPGVDIYFFGFGENQEFQDYLDRVTSYSIYDAGIEVTSADDIVTLSTCANDTTKRFVVHAKRIG